MYKYKILHYHDLFLSKSAEKIIIYVEYVCTFRMNAFEPVRKSRVERTEYITKPIKTSDQMKTQLKFLIIKPLFI